METIKNVSLNLETLDVVALSFISTILKIATTEFKSYDPNATSENFRKLASDGFEWHLLNHY